MSLFSKTEEIELTQEQINAQIIDKALGVWLDIIHGVSAGCASNKSTDEMLEIADDLFTGTYARGLMPWLDLHEAEEDNDSGKEEVNE